MDRDPRESEPSEDDPIDDVREAVISADATGLIAGEELITEAETLLPIEVAAEPVPPRPAPKRPKKRK
jgi:hypothetical protein